MFANCPACGAEDAIELECESTNDDYRSWTYAVVVRVTCGCELTGEQQDAVQNDCTETCNEPWEP